MKPSNKNSIFVAYIPGKVHFFDDIIKTLFVGEIRSQVNEIEENLDSLRLKNSNYIKSAISYSTFALVTSIALPSLVILLTINEVIPIGIGNVITIPTILVSIGILISIIRFLFLLPKEIIVNRDGIIIKNVFGSYNQELIVLNKIRELKVLTHDIDGIKVNNLFITNDNKKPIESAPIITYLKDELVPRNLATQVIEYLKTHCHVTIHYETAQ